MGLAGGLTASFALSLLVALAFPVEGELRWTYLLMLAVGAVLAYSRARRLSSQYLRELVVEYIRTCKVLNETQRRDDPVTVF